MSIGPTREAIHMSRRDCVQHNGNSMAHKTIEYAFHYLNQHFCILNSDNSNTYRGRHISEK